MDSAQMNCCQRKIRILTNRIDPKCNWAVHHLELFPVEINRADYYTLLRVPGIGTKSARRIMAAGGTQSWIFQI